jgi:hypothetical protein
MMQLITKPSLKENGHIIPHSSAQSKTRKINLGSNIIKKNFSQNLFT